MTNAEKFKEVFGVGIDMSAQPNCIVTCPEGMESCPECPYHYFWEKEYKEQKDEQT